MFLLQTAFVKYMCLYPQLWNFAHMRFCCSYKHHLIVLVHSNIIFRSLCTLVAQGMEILCVSGGYPEIWYLCFRRRDCPVYVNTCYTTEPYKKSATWALDVYGELAVCLLLCCFE